MEPVEINAGAWYLRALRQDELLDDRPALADLGETDPRYVARRRAQWASDTGYTWAVCEPTTAGRRGVRSRYRGAHPRPRRPCGRRVLGLTVI